MPLRSVKGSGHGPARRRRAEPRLCQQLCFGAADEPVLSRISSDEGILLHQQKKPHETSWGGRHGSFSRRARPLRLGRVAWLTAFQPITVAGPRPIHTAFPASLACKLKIECMTGLPDCQCATENGPAKDGTAEKTPPLFSDFSSWVCVFRLARGGLPANLRGDRA